MPAIRTSQISTRNLPHSSDTEPFETPLRKRFRLSDEDTPSSSRSPRSPLKRQRRDSSTKPKKIVNIEEILREIVAQPTSHEAILSLKAIPRDESSVRILANSLIDSAKSAVMERYKRKRAKLLLETELYLEWLNELDYVVTAFDIVLNAKVPGTRKRVTGLGRTSYMMLYNLVDEFIDEVNAHHDRPSRNSTEPPLYPATLTLVEEAKDPSTDSRSEKAVKLAEQALLRIDDVFADVVKRYKVECGRNNQALATRIGIQEHALAKGCCLLCEQTGYGSTEDDMGDTLMHDTRDIMAQWKNEYEDQLVDSD